MEVLMISSKYDTTEEEDRFWDQVHTLIGVTQEEFTQQDTVDGGMTWSQVHYFYEVRVIGSSEGDWIGLYGPETIHPSK